jgi:hypothetical protein
MPDWLSEWLLWPFDDPVVGWGVLLFAVSLTVTVIRLGLERIRYRADHRRMQAAIDQARRDNGDP